MSICELRWSLKKSFINSPSRWLRLCSYILMSLSQVSLASLYVSTKSSTNWISALAINSAVRTFFHYHAKKSFDHLPTCFQFSLRWDIYAICQ
jgi:hypothetical protein